MLPTLNEAVLKRVASSAPSTLRRQQRKSRVASNKATNKTVQSARRQKRKSTQHATKLINKADDSGLKRAERQKRRSDGAAQLQVARKKARERVRMAKKKQVGKDRSRVQKMTDLKRMRSAEGKGAANKTIRVPAHSVGTHTRASYSEDVVQPLHEIRSSIPRRYMTKDTRSAERATVKSWKYMQKVVTNPHAQLIAAQVAIATVSPRILGPFITKRLARSDIKFRVRKQFEQELLSQSKYYADQYGISQGEFMLRVPGLLKKRMQDQRVKKLISLKVEEAIHRGLYIKKGKELERELRAIAHFILGVAQLGKLVTGLKGGAQSPPPEGYKEVNKHHTSAYTRAAVEKAEAAELRLSRVVDNLPKSMRGDDSPAVRTHDALRNAMNQAKEDIKEAMKDVADDDESRKFLIIATKHIGKSPLKFKPNPSYGGEMPALVKRLLKATKNLEATIGLADDVVELKGEHADDKAALEDRLHAFYDDLDDEFHNMFGQSAAKMGRRSTTAGSKIYKTVMGAGSQDGVWHKFSRDDEKSYLSSRIMALYKDLNELEVKGLDPSFINGMRKKLDGLEHARQDIVRRINVSAGKDPKRPDFHMGRKTTFKDSKIIHDEDGTPHVVNAPKKDIFLSAYSADRAGGEGAEQGLNGILSNMEERLTTWERTVAKRKTTGKLAQGIQDSILRHMATQGIESDIVQIYDAAVKTFTARGGKAAFVAEVVQKAGKSGGPVRSNKVARLFQIDDSILQSASSEEYTKNQNEAYAANVYDAITLSKKHASTKSADPDEVKKQVKNRGEKIMQNRAKKKADKKKTTVKTTKEQDMGTPEAHRDAKRRKAQEIFDYNLSLMALSKVTFSKDTAKTVNRHLTGLYGIHPGAVAIINGEQWKVVINQRKGGVYSFQRGTSWLDVWEVELDKIEVGKVLVNDPDNYMKHLLKASTLKQAEALAKAMKKLPAKQAALATEYIELAQTQAFSEGTPQKILQNTYKLALRNPQIYKDVASGEYDPDTIEKLMRLTFRGDFPAELGGEGGFNVLMAHLHRASDPDKSLHPSVASRDRIASMLDPIIAPEKDKEVEQGITAAMIQRSPFEVMWKEAKSNVLDGRVAVIYRDKTSKLYNVDLVIKKNKTMLSGKSITRMLEPQFIQIPAAYVPGMKEMSRRLKLVIDPEGFHSGLDAMNKLSDAVGHKLAFRESNGKQVAMLRMADMDNLSVKRDHSESPVEFAQRASSKTADNVFIYVTVVKDEDGSDREIYGLCPALSSEDPVSIISQLRKDHRNWSIIEVVHTPVSLTTEQVTALRTTVGGAKRATVIRTLVDMANATVADRQSRLYKAMQVQASQDYTSGIIDNLRESVYLRPARKKLYEYDNTHLAPHERKSTMDHVWDVLQMPELGLDIGYQAGVDYAIRGVYEKVYAELNVKYRHRVDEIARELKVSRRIAELMLADEIKKKMRTDPALIASIKNKIQRTSNPKIAGAAVGYFIGHVTRTVLDRAILGPQEAMDETGLASKFGKAAFGLAKSTLFGAFFTMALMTVQRLLMTSMNDLGDSEKDDVVRDVSKEISKDAVSNGAATKKDVVKAQAKLTQSMRNPVVKRRVETRVQQYSRKPVRMRTVRDKKDLSRDIASIVRPQVFTEGFFDKMFPKKHIPRTSTKGHETHTVTDPTGTGLILGGLLKYAIARVASEAVVAASEKYVRSSYAKKIVAKQMEHQILRELQQRGVPIDKMTQSQLSNMRNAIALRMKKPKAREHIKWLESQVKKDKNFIRKKGEVNWWIRRTMDFIALPVILGQLHKEWINPEFQHERDRWKAAAAAAKLQKHPLDFGTLDRMQI